MSHAPANPPKLTWRPALDGLRGFAILAVIFYHFHHASFGAGTRALLPGGSLGVDLFFVLSGFLITTLLLQELTSTGSISVRRFYARRALRLLPALIVMLIGFGFIFGVCNQFSFTGPQPASLFFRNLFFVATYSLNWLSAFGGERAWGIGHLWSLSVEEQFYLAWPPILVLLSRLSWWPRALFGVSLALFLASALLPLWPALGPGRLYFGTDFRLQALLAGCLLAQLYVAGRLRPSIAAHRSFQAALGGSVVYLLLLAVFVSDRDAVMFSGGFTLIALASACDVAGALFVEAGMPAALLANPAIVYVGKRSYALYLWHYPIVFWLRGLETIPGLVSSFALSFLAAELSFRLVEQPALQLKAKLRPRRPAADREPALEPSRVRASDAA